MAQNVGGVSSNKQQGGRVPIAAAASLKGILAYYYADLKNASTNPKRKVAWVSSVAPVEILRALGFDVYFPENHGALLGATRQASKYIPYAVAEGYSPDICAYLTSDIGAHIAGHSPLSDAYGMEGPPKPDVLVYSTNQCRDVADWWGYYGRRYNAPVVGLHPPHMLDSVQKEHLEMVKAEHERMIQALEKIAGKKLDRDHLSDVVKRSQEASILWRDILSLCATKPSPLTFFDAVIHMAPIVLLRGSDAAISYYSILKSELEERIANRIGAVQRERFRLYWEGMPIWGALRELSTLFFELNTSIVASTYCNSWAFHKLDPNNVDETLALVYTEIFINRTDDAKLRILSELLKEFSISGVIFHDCKTCPNNTNCRYGMPERIYQDLGIPTVTIGGDMVDLRLYSPDQARTTIEGFVEQLGGC